MGKFEEFYKQHCLDHFGYDPDLNLIFEKHEDGSYIQIEVENAKKVFKHQQAKVEELQTLYTQQGINMLKTQKRVDGLIKKWKSESEYYDSIASEDCVANTLNECIDDLEQALKGEG